MKQIHYFSVIFTVLTLASCASKSQSAAKPATAEPTSKATKGSSPAASKTAKAEPQSSKNGGAVDGITVTKAISCRSVEDRSPVGEAESFPSNVGRVYLFTQVETAVPGNTSIQHIWYHDGKKMAEVTLPVTTSPWRTYSSKAIDPAKKGMWKVDITTPKGTVISSAEFKIE